MVATALKLMTRALQINMVLFLTLTFGSFGMAQIKQSFAASSKSLAMIEEDVVRAGDIFEGLTRKADTVIGPAPLPGRDMILTSSTLLRIAVALDLPWRPQSGMERVVVRRAATVINQNIIEAAIMSAAYDRGVEGDIRVNFSEQLPLLTLPQSEPETVHIGSFDYDPTGGYFSAELVAPSLDNPMKRQIVSGKIERMMKIPVLSTTLQNGDLIGAKDISWISLPAYKVQQNYIMDEAQLIGLTPRRTVMPGEPLRFTQIIEPVLVERGDKVTITYADGPIQLISEGKALQNGARGDVIRVVNFSSNRTIDANVKSSGQVIVQ